MNSKFIHSNETQQQPPKTAEWTPRGYSYRRRQNPDSSTRKLPLWCDLRAPEMWVKVVIFPAEGTASSRDPAGPGLGMAEGTWVSPAQATPSWSGRSRAKQDPEISPQADPTPWRASGEGNRCWWGCVTSPELGASDKLSFQKSPKLNSIRFSWRLQKGLKYYRIFHCPRIYKALLISELY